MAIPAQYTNIKSAGMYRFVFDKSELPANVAQTLRLLIGYSEKGRYNTPVLINDPGEFVNNFGDRNKKLEKYGAWFHRMALQALEAGPILCLNLKKFSDLEKVKAVTFNNEDVIGSPLEISVPDIFNKTRFWTLEPQALQDAIGDDCKYVSICATDTKSTSKTIIMRGSKPGKSYDVTVRDWFANAMNGEEIPTYLEGHEYDKLSQYFAEVYVFKGEFTPTIASSEALARYFEITSDGKVKLKDSITDAFGKPQDTLAALASDPNSNFVNAYSGILLPEFVNTNGVNISLDAVFNADHANHKLMMNFNQDALYNDSITVDELDTTGWSDISAVNMFSIHSATPTFNALTYVEGTGWNVTGTNENPMYVKWTKGDVLDVENNTITVAKTKDTGWNIGDKFKTGDAVATVTGKTEDGNNFVYVFDKDMPDTADICQFLTSFTTSSAGLMPTYLEGYTYNESKPESGSDADKLAWQEMQLSALSEYEGLRIALTEGVDIQYRYIVDTFQSFVGQNIKEKLAGLAKAKFNSTAILNFPFIRTFINSTDPSFTDAKNQFQMKYVAQGYNPSKPASLHFSITNDDTKGASWAGYYTAVKIKDSVSGTVINCPSAALVSNAFMLKYSKYFVYDSVAGINRGLLSTQGLIGPDYNFSRADLDILQPMGVNALIYVPNRGTVINSNVTAKQTPKTMLSYLNVRELVTYIQDEVEIILRDHQHEKNTQTLRDNVKTKVDVLLSKVESNGGVFKFSTICDETNNTDDIINEGMFVIGISIEAATGADKMIQELTIYRKGGMPA